MPGESHHMVEMLMRQKDEVGIDHRRKQGLVGRRIEAGLRRSAHLLHGFGVNRRVDDDGIARPFELNRTEGHGNRVGKPAGLNGNARKVVMSDLEPAHPIRPFPRVTGNQRAPVCDIHHALGGGRCLGPGKQQPPAGPQQDRYQ